MTHTTSRTTSPRRTRAQREEHLRLIERALVDGVKPHDLLTALAEKYALTPRQVQADLRDVWRRLTDEGLAIARRQFDPQLLALAVRRRDRIYHEAVKQGDRRIALEAEKDRCRLLGIYPEEQRSSAGETHVSDQADVSRFDAAQIDAAIEHELAQLLQAGQAATSPPPATPHA